MAEEKSFKGYIIATILASLFILSFYNFAVGIGNEYDVDLTIEDQYLNLSSLETSLDSQSEDSEAWESQSQQDNPFTSGGDVLFLGLWDTMTNMWDGAKAMMNIFLGGIYRVLGVPPLVSGIILSIFILGLIFAGWRAIKSGS